MRRALPSLLLFSALLALPFTPSLRSQTDSDATRGPDQFSETTIPGIDVYPYPNMPFTGSFTGVRVMKLQDGGTITTTSTVRVARDSQGRVFRERHYYAPNETDPAKTQIDFFIFDPTTHTQLDCFAASKRCSRGFYYRNLNMVDQKVGSFDDGRRFLSRESLGSKSIDGLNAVGTRETVTIAQGVIGNDRPVNLVRDFWYSPDLKTNLQVIRTDPRDGVVTVTLTVQSRGEPDPSLFAIPAGYSAPPPAKGIATSSPMP